MFEAPLARDPGFIQCDARLRILLHACEVIEWGSTFAIVDGKDEFPSLTVKWEIIRIVGVLLISDLRCIMENAVKVHLYMKSHCFIALLTHTSISPRNDLPLQSVQFECWIPDPRYKKGTKMFQAQPPDITDAIPLIYGARSAGMSVIVIIKYALVRSPLG